MHKQAGLQYSKLRERALLFDLVLPDGDGPFPLLVFLHGGGWISGDRTMYAEEAEWFAAQGWACACIDYRLAPLHAYPAAYDDVVAFLRFIQERGTQFNISPDKIVLFGNSAGGHLAALAGLRNPELVQGVVCVSGISNLDHPEATHFAIAWSFVEQFMGGPYAGSESLYKEASPILHVSSGAPQLLVIHGTSDDVVPCEQSEKLARALSEVGASSRYLPLPGEGHSFTWEGWTRIREETLAFLRSR